MPVLSVSSGVKDSVIFLASSHPFQSHVCRWQNFNMFFWATRKNSWKYTQLHGRDYVSKHFVTQETGGTKNLVGKCVGKDLLLLLALGSILPWIQMSSEEREDFFSIIQLRIKFPFLTHPRITVPESKSRKTCSQLG